MKIRRLRVGRALERRVGSRGCPKALRLDGGRECTAEVFQGWCEFAGSRPASSSPENPMRTPSSSASTGPAGPRCSTRTSSRRPTKAPRSPRSGGSTTTNTHRTTRSAESRRRESCRGQPPRSPVMACVLDGGACIFRVDRAPPRACPVRGLPAVRPRVLALEQHAFRPAMSSVSSMRRTIRPIAVQVSVPRRMGDAGAGWSAPASTWTSQASPKNGSGSDGSRSFATVPAPTTGSFAGSSSPIWTRTVAWSQWMCS